MFSGMFAGNINNNNSHATSIVITEVSNAKHLMGRSIEERGTLGRLSKIRTTLVPSFAVLKEVISLPNCHQNFVMAPAVDLVHFTFALMADVRYVICYLTNSKLPSECYLKVKVG